MLNVSLHTNPAGNVSETAVSRSSCEAVAAGPMQYGPMPRVLCTPSCNFLFLPEHHPDAAWRARIAEYNGIIADCYAQVCRNAADEEGIPEKWEAEKVLLGATPPDFYALAQQQRLKPFVCDDEQSLGFDDLHRLQRDRRNGNDDSFYEALLHRHTLKLAACDDPILYV